MESFFGENKMSQNLLEPIKKNAHVHNLRQVFCTNKGSSINLLARAPRIPEKTRSGQSFNTFSIIDCNSE